MVLASCLCVVEELINVDVSARNHKRNASHLSVLNGALEHADRDVLGKPATWQRCERYVVSDVLNSSDCHLLEVVPITAIEHTEPIGIIVCCYHGSVLHDLVSVCCVAVVVRVQTGEVSVWCHEDCRNLRQPNLAHEAIASCLAVC